MPQPKLKATGSYTKKTKDGQSIKVTQTTYSEKEKTCKKCGKTHTEKGAYCQACRAAYHRARYQEQVNEQRRQEAKLQDYKQ